MIQLADAFSFSNPFHPLESSANKEQYKYFQDWIDSGANIMIWDYWNLRGIYFDPPRIETVFNSIKPDLNFFHKNKMRSIFIQTEIDEIRPQNFMMLNFFVGSRLMVNRKADVEEAANTFIRNYYGPAHNVMAKYFKLIREGVAKDFQPANSATVGHWK